ncbi:MAG: DUF4375 domain-containing protein [Planctomycetota bacterium]
MNSYRQTFSKLLADHKDAAYDPEHREFVESIASALYERYEDLPPILEWPKAVRFFYACYDLNFQVGNGGFAQAAYNAPELFPIAAEALDDFGHKEAAQLCRTAISMLPSELAEHLNKGLTETPDLQDVFDHFDESAMEALDERTPDNFWVDDRLQKLVEDNRDEFLSIDSIS